MFMNLNTNSSPVAYFYSEPYKPRLLSRSLCYFNPGSKCDFLCRFLSLPPSQQKVKNRPCLKRSFFLRVVLEAPSSFWVSSSAGSYFAAYFTSYQASAVLSSQHYELQLLFSKVMDTFIKKRIYRENKLMHFGKNIPIPTLPNLTFLLENDLAF